MRKRLRSIAKAKLRAEGHTRIFRKSIAGASKKKGTSFFSDFWRDYIQKEKETELDKISKLLPRWHK